MALSLRETLCQNLYYFNVYYAQKFCIFKLTPHFLFVFLPIFTPSLILPPPLPLNLVKHVDYGVINSSLDSNSFSLVCLSADSPTVNPILCGVVNILLHSTRRCKKHSQLTHIITMIHPGKVSVSERNLK